jgi:hypothetical protein
MGDRAPRALGDGLRDDVKEAAPLSTRPNLKQQAEAILDKAKAAIEALGFSHVRVMCFNGRPMDLQLLADGNYYVYTIPARTDA